MPLGINLRHSSCDAGGGYRMAHGWRHTKTSPPSALLGVARVHVLYAIDIAMHPFYSMGPLHYSIISRLPF